MEWPSVVGALHVRSFCNVVLVNDIVMSQLTSWSSSSGILNLFVLYYSRTWFNLQLWYDSLDFLIVSQFVRNYQET